MNIVILDGFTLNPGDLSWSEFEQFGKLTVYDRTPAELTLERAKSAEILITNKTLLSADLLMQLPLVKYIGILATGYNVVDIEYCNKNNIIVTNVPNYSSDAVAQMTFAFILELTNQVALHSKSVYKGDWQKSTDFCYWLTHNMELRGKTIGLIGFGNIGTKVSEIAKAFGLHVLVYRKNPQKSAEVSYCTLKELLQKSDIVSLHCPLTDETKEIINAETLSYMKKEALLINTGRGPLINEEALANALNNDQLRGAGLDVLYTEPPKNGSPLLGAKNCFITPHIAWAARESRQRLASIALSNLKAFLQNTPENVIRLKN